MMKFGLWTSHGARNSVSVFDAFKKGAIALGHTVVENSQACDVEVIWSVLWHGRMRANHPVWQRCKNINKPVIVLEVGGIKRGETWKVGLGGVNRDAFFSESGQSSKRANKLGLTLAPWKTNGEHILICGQHERSEQWQGQQPVTQWMQTIIDAIRKHSDRKIIARPHPRFPANISLQKNFNVELQKPNKLRNTYDDYDINFQNAWAVVSHSSNPGPHAILSGVPAFVSSSSLAYPVGNTDYSLIESPLMPDRTQWLNDYAHTEYTLDEIREGIPLECLTEKLT
jgi:hypothetical protein